MKIHFSWRLEEDKSRPCSPHSLCFLLQAVSKPLGVYFDLLWQCILSYLTALLSTSLLSAPSATLLLYQALAQLKRFISRKS